MRGFEPLPRLMERLRPLSTIKEEVSLGARVSTSLTRPVFEAVKPIAVREASKQYEKLHKKYFSSIKSK